MNEERVKIVNKIKEYEKKGGDYFFMDVENDPPYSQLKPNDVDYLKKKLSSKIKTYIAYRLATNFNNKFKKQYNIQVEGEKNIEDVTSGAIITSNHFSQFENLCVYNAVHKTKEKRRLHFVVREGNYFLPGGIGYILKNYYTLPLSSNFHTMKNFNLAIKEYLKRKEFILIYPEQSMWWNYRKPRPYKLGGFLMAAKNNVPVIPCFTTIKTVEGKDSDGFPNENYTIHVMPAIYPDEKLSPHENAEIMMKKNFEVVKQKYEEIYKIPLTYNGDNFII